MTGQIDRRRFHQLALAGVASLAAPAAIGRAQAQTPAGFKVRTYKVADGMRARDVAAAPDGSILFLGQGDGTMGRLDPQSGAFTRLDLGKGAAPHGIVIGPDKAAWITEGGQNAIARVDLATQQVKLFRLPETRANANLNTGVFDPDGIYWFTGQNGIYGRLDPASGAMKVFDAPKGRGPYGITRTPKGDIWFVSLAGNYLAQIDRESAATRVIEPPTPKQGARRVWSDSTGRLWISEWNSGNVSMFDPASSKWGVWKLPGEKPRCYSVYVDEKDKVWLTDFSANAIVRFDPQTEKFTSFPSDMAGANVRQMDGRPGEAWGGESGTNRLVVVQTLSA